MTQIGNHDDAYLSTPLEEKLAWFRNAPGLSAVEPARQFMAGAAALYTESDNQVRTTMRSLGADWAGEAATNAGTTLQRAADWSQGAGAGHAAGGQTVEGYGQSFESVRGQVHWDDPWAWGWNDTASAAASAVTLSPAPFLANLTTDYFTTAQQNRTNDAVAVAALRAHEQQTRAAVGSFPAIAPAGIDPSSADTGGPRVREGLGPAPVAPTPVATAGGGGIGTGAVLGAVGGGVAAGVGAAAGAAARSAEPTGGGTGAGGSGTAGGGGGGAPIGPIAGTAGAAAGPIGNAGPTTAPPGSPGAGGRGGAGARIPPGTVGGGAGAGGVGAEGGAAEAGVARPGGQGGLGSQIGQGGLGRQGAPGGGAGTPSRSTAIPNVPSPGDEAPGARTSLRGGSADRASLPGLPSEPRGGDPAGRWTVAPPLGSEASGGGRGPSEPGALSRGPASGTEFAARLPSGSPETPPAAARGGTAGSGMPFLGGMGAGAGARATEHRHAYWVRSSEPFDVPLPPHGDGLLQGSDE